MSKNKKEDLIIDAVSGIDEDIVDKNLKKRFELWCKKGAKRFSMIKIAAIAACVALLATFIVVILPLIPTEQIPTGQIPVYQGMTVSNEAPVINTESADARPFTNNKAISLLGKHNGKDDQKNRRPVVDIVKDSLTIDTESEYLYYSKPNEDIYITVHVNNPGEFEILSFTLNGVKYSSYMFEEGSDLENLVLKINVGDAEGVVEYTIDAIKYVEGTEIKDVLMEGDKTVSVAITPDAPTAEVTDITVGISDISFNAALNDEKDLVNTSGEDYFAVICNNETIVDKQIISSKGKTNISFTGLDPETSYRYAIIGVYDAIDGNGKCIHVLHEEEFTTQSLVNISDSYLDGADVCFDITWHEGYTGNQTLDALTLYDGEDKLTDLDVTADRIADLPFDKEFTLVATYTYNGTQYETYKTIYSPKSSEGLEMNYGVVVGVGSCSDTVLYINAPIADNAFDGNAHIKEVYLGSGVETVGRYAFESCSELTTVGISDGVKKIEQGAFNACDSLEAVHIGDIVSWCEIEFENTTSNPLFCAKNLYLNGELVTDLVIPEGITSINCYTFSGCTSIERVVIPEGITNIGSCAFVNCRSIESVSIPSSVKTIGSGAFGHCDALEKVYISDMASWCNISFGGVLANPLVLAGNLYLNGELVTVLRIPEGITKIDIITFLGCNNIEEVIGPDSLTESVSWDDILGSVGTSPSDEWEIHTVYDVREYVDDVALLIPKSALTDDGLYATVYSFDATPWLRLVRNEAVDLKKGVYMEISVDEFNYGAPDCWFDVMFWDQMYMIPGDPSFGAGAQCLVRPNVNNITWFKQGFNQVVGYFGEFNPSVVDGKHYLTVELSWDEANKTFVYTINGVSAPQEIISYMNEKWGGSDSYAYVGFCFQHNVKDEKIGCTILKYGTSAETATVPGQ